MKAAKVAAITVPLVLLTGLGYGAYRFFGSGFKANQSGVLMKQTESPTATGFVPETDSVVGTPDEPFPPFQELKESTSTENLAPARATSSPEILLPAAVTSTENATSTDATSSTVNVPGEIMLPVVTSTEMPTSTEANQTETATATN